MASKKKPPYTGRDYLIIALRKGATKSGPHQNKKHQTRKNECRKKVKADDDDV